MAGGELILNLCRTMLVLNPVRLVVVGFKLSHFVLFLQHTPVEFLLPILLTFQLKHEGSVALLGRGFDCEIVCVQRGTKEGANDAINDKKVVNFNGDHSNPTPDIVVNTSTGYNFLCYSVQ